MRGEVYALLAVLIGAATVPVSKILLTGGMTPFFMSSLMFFLGSMACMTYLLLTGQKSALNARDAWPEIISATIILMAGYAALVYWGISQTSSVNAAILLNTEMLFSVLVFSFLGESLTWRRAGGAGLIFLGVCVVTLFGDEGISLPNIGDMAIILATLLAPIGNLFQKRGLQKVRTYTLIFWRFLLGSGILMLYSLFFFETGELGQNLATLGELWPWMLTLGLLGAFMGGMAFIEGMRRLGVMYMNILYAATPLASLVVGAFLLGVVPNTWQILAGLIVVGGVLVSLDSISFVRIATDWYRNLRRLPLSQKPSVKRLEKLSKRREVYRPRRRKLARMIRIQEEKKRQSLKKQIAQQTPSS